MNARVVDEHIDATVVAEHAVDTGVHLFTVCDIANSRLDEAGTTFRRDAFRGRREALCVGVDHDRPRAVMGQRPRDGFTQTLGRSGYDRHFPCEIKQGGRVRVHSDSRTGG